MNTRNDRAFNASGRYAYRAFSLDGTFGVGVTGSEFPRRSASGGYAEDAFMRNVDATLAWQASRLLVLRANGAVTLSSYRYTVIGSFPTPPVPRDLYQQFYRLSAIYNPTSKFGTDLALNVSRTQFINIPAASTAANNEVRGYRGYWNWTYRPLTGLTITQRNQLGADYTNAQLTSNDRLALDYGTTTTLNVVISKLQLDVIHTSRYQPSGGYAQDADGTYFLATADEQQSYQLAAAATYSVTSGISFFVRPQYIDSERENSVDGELVPQRQSRSLSFSGGASLNLVVGKKASLTGNISRTYNGNRSITYVSGVPSESPRAESDFWNGLLSFSWNL